MEKEEYCHTSGWELETFITGLYSVSVGHSVYYFKDIITKLKIDILHEIL